MDTELNRIRTASKPSCILCGEKGEVLYRDVPDALFGSPGTWNFRKCVSAACGLLWLDPTPLAEDLHLAYGTYFTHEQVHAGLVERLRKGFHLVYLALNWAVARFFGGYEAKRRMGLMYLDSATPGRLLDVGCGDGTFLNRMRRHGWSVDGLDFDPQAIKNAKLRYGLELRTGDLQSAHFPDDNFDAVTLSHVIEHVPDPISLLQEVRRILRPGGRLVVTTPNADSIGHQKYREHWFGLDPPRHLQVFPLDALRDCAVRSGFTEPEITTTAANADIFIGSSCSIREAAKHSQSGRVRPGIRIMRGLYALVMQQREFTALRKNSGIAEEAVLVGNK